MSIRSPQQRRLAMSAGTAIVGAALVAAAPMGPSRPFAQPRDLALATMASPATIVADLQN